MGFYLSKLHTLVPPHLQYHHLALTFMDSDLFYTPINGTLLPLGLPPTHPTKQRNLHTEVQAIFTLLLPIFITASIYTLKSQVDRILPFPTPLSVQEHSLSPPFTVTQAKMLTYSLSTTHIINFLYLPQCFSINPIICLLKPHKTNIYSTFFTCPFSPKSLYRLSDRILAYIFPTTLNKLILL